jgi:methyltransferase (TIGR00027 family)
MDNGNKMENKSTSVAFTAYRVSFYVALEQYQPAESRLIHDNLAGQLLPDNLRLVLTTLGIKPLRRVYINLIDRNSPGMRCGFIRKRYIDDILIEALLHGIQNVIILGSGLDTRAYRLPQLSALPVYEVDLPETIIYKKKRLQQIYGAIPSHVRLVPIDFNCQNISEVLEGNGYSKDQKSFFIWEGVTQYISDSAVYNVFEFLQQAKSDSCIVFTYILKDFINGVNSFGLKKLYNQTRVEKQLWQFGLHPSQVVPFLNEFGWNEIEQVGTEEYRKRYLIPLGRTDTIMEIERSVFAKKV